MIKANYSIRDINAKNAKSLVFRPAPARVFRPSPEEVTRTPLSQCATGILSRLLPIKKTAQLGLPSEDNAIWPIFFVRKFNRSSSLTLNRMRMSEF